MKMPCRERGLDMKIAFSRVPFQAEQKEELDALAKEAGYDTVWYAEGVTPRAEDLQDCVAVLGGMSPEIIRQLPALRWLQTSSAGVDKYCGDIFACKDAVLTNGSGAFGIAIAEYMLGGLLMLMRLMPDYARNQQQHIWRCMGNCRSIYQSTLTVVGMGDIGSRFAHIAKAMGATVRGVRRTAGEKPADFDAVYTSDRLAEAVRDVDAVVMCLPGTPATRGMLNRECFAQMSPRTIVVNCGRGCTVDEAALVDALREKRIAGAVLDVMEKEPLPPDSPLWDMEQVILTPHISGHDDDLVNGQFIFQIFKENLTRFLAGQPLNNVVDRAQGY